MAGLTAEEKSSSDARILSSPSPCTCKSEPTEGSAKTSPLNPLDDLIFVRYRDHVLYNRSSALVMQPQTREAVGWLVYDCELYVILSWDRDADPPTLHGGDVKASALVLLKGDILDLQKLKVCPQPLQKTSNWHLNPKQPIQEDEYAFRPSERKTQPKIKKREEKNR
jgi:hypothetical protein